MQRQLDDSKKGLQSEIDGNHFTNTNRINDIAEKLANILKDASKDKDDLLLRHSIYIRTVSSKHLLKLFFSLVLLEPNALYP